MKKASGTVAPVAAGTTGPKAALQRLVRKPWVRKWWPALVIGGVALVAITALAFRTGPVRGSAFAREAFPLLEQDSVQRELELTTDQVGRVKLMSQQRQTAREAMRDLPRDERERKSLAESAATEKEIRALLDGPQMKRLKQICLQQRGQRAWGDDEVVHTLKLTHDQRVQLATMCDEYDTKRRELQKVENPQERQKKADTLKQTTDEHLLEVLTPDQQAKWDELMGPKFSGEIRRGGGDPGPGAPADQGGRRGRTTTDKGKGGTAKAK